MATAGGITRPALRYHGGKFRLASWIFGHFPPHTCYVEPFGGAASVLLCKPPAPFEVLNDRDAEVITFFRVLRERPADLIRALDLTPYARAELELAHQPAEDDLERARRLYVRAWQCRGGPRSQWRSGWRYQHSDNRGSSVADDFAATDRLWTIAARLKRVQIECDEALAVIVRYDRPHTLVYADPPYLPDARSQRWRGKAYQHELTADDHRRLAAVLHQLQGMAVVSGYRSALYDELYGDWRRVTCQSQTETGRLATECLWLSPAVVARGRQLRLAMEDAPATGGGRHDE